MEREEGESVFDRTMNDIQQEQVLSMCEMCGCDFDIALPYLQCSDGSLEAGMHLR